MNKIKLNRSTILTAVVMLAAGLIIGWLVKPSGAADTSHDGHQQETNDSKATTWTCSMHPQIRQSEPGQCPLCGMDLIPLEQDVSTDDPAEIKMSPTAMQLANVQTAMVGFGMPSKEVRMNGKVQPDERRVFSQVTHLDGRVEQLAVNFTGESIRKGQTLASIYSPELVTAQEELFAALKIKDMQPNLFEAAKAKLRNWKLTDAQIDKIISTGKAQERFPILADVSGIVMAKKVNLGDYLMRGMPLYDIVDLSKVWVLFDVYESDMPWAKVGSLVSFTVQALPGETFTGKISFIDPVIDPATRVAKARVEVSNPGARLKPEMFVSGLIKTQLSGKKESIMVPKTAVMWTGERSVIYVKKSSEQGISFKLQEISLGPLVGDNYVVKKGLEAGTEIAVNGTFSIDAAAQLAGQPSMMNPGGGAVPAGHQHGGSATANTASTDAMQLGKDAKAAVNELFIRYFPLKDALINTDLSGAIKHAANMKKTIERISMSLFVGQAHNHWMKHSGAAMDALNKLIAAKTVEEARAHFKPLSLQILAMAKAFGPFEAAIYVQHCPMADNDRGADWLSLDKEIRNPYFGDKMMKCGSVTETIR